MNLFYMITLHMIPSGWIQLLEQSLVPSNSPDYRRSVGGDLLKDLHSARGGGSIVVTWHFLQNDTPQKLLAIYQTPHLLFAFKPNEQPVKRNSDLLHLFCFLSIVI